MAFNCIIVRRAISNEFRETAFHLFSTSDSISDDRSNNPTHKGIMRVMTSFAQDALTYW